MKAAIKTAMPEIKVTMTHNVAEAITILTEDKGVRLASLDHDLGLGQRQRRLSGTDVALALANLPASFPVMVHSSNASSGRGMAEIMANAGWTARYVGRNGETQDAWLATWVSAVRDALMG